ncbi:MAG: S8 family serine peptidase [Candidatus Kapabacteria bacterium]|nr:S8 family serine peptidase [Ignavibacteriota bacterium]MCW5884137.1 S8 family serine peptidase [Candidatus Kapabacteria bacterium]
MKNILLFAFILININQLSAQDYHLGSVTVKFKPESNHWKLLRDNNLDKLIELDSYLGNHKISSYINPAIISNLNKSGKDVNNLLSSKKINSLERIFVIDYEKNIDPLILSRKLKSFDFIEYAEPRYIHKIFDEGIPNDSLFDKLYHMETCNIIEAWQHIDTAGKIVKIAVVDTGVDYLHEDLEGTIYINPGEDGLDENGNDKRTNGIDDDGNGFIDDYMGWDFGADNIEAGFDNDPMPGHPHGTHVAGIIAAVKNNEIGIAGIGLNTKIIPVKIGYDSPNSRSLTNSYDGLLYAAIAGSDIINCSWGSGGYSQAEQEVVDAVNELGSLIVAAAGNNGAEIAFYPASYDGVISVAAIDALDFRSSFTNYFSTVDISAPGVDVMSTIPVNEYVAWSGTSMASPVVAGIAGLVKMNYPKYSNLQIGEHLKATAQNIDAINPGYSGLLGTGKVDALRAATEEYPVSITLENYKIIEEISDGIIENGERIDIKIELFNALNPVSDVRVFALSTAYYQPQFINDELSAGNFAELESKIVDGTISLRVSNAAELNSTLPITIRIIDGDGRMFTSTITILINPSWRTMRHNNIALTFTSQGNIAYDDFPNNNRGDGFSYNESSNLLFEGALMIAYSHDILANVARGSSGSAKNRDFLIDKPIISEIKSIPNHEYTYTEFNSREDSLISPVKVKQRGYQFSDEGKDDIIFAVYDIINTSDKYQDSVYVGLYLDWDIGPGGSNNKAIWHNIGNFAYQKNIVDENLPVAAVQLMTNQRVNFFAIDNDGETEENPGVYDGFTKEEKWRMLSGRIGRDSSNSTDASMVFGAGPLRLRAGDTSRVAFAFFSGNSLDDVIVTKFLHLQNAYDLIEPKDDFATNPQKNDINLLFPNPASRDVTIELAISDKSHGTLTLWDMNGKLIDEILSFDLSNYEDYRGIYRIKYNLDKLSQGQYILRFLNSWNESVEILNVIK